MNFVASFGINTIAAGIVYELNALVCSLFNQVCQLFSIYKYGISAYIGKI